MSSPDGDGVLVPAGLARQLAYLAVVGARTIQARDGGLPLPAGMAGLLAELASIASDGSSRIVGPEQFTPALGSWLSAREASEASGYSAPRLRELARGGRVIARKFGDRWQYDASIADHGKGRNVA